MEHEFFYDMSDFFKYVEDAFKTVRPTTFDDFATIYYFFSQKVKIAKRDGDVRDMLRFKDFMHYAETFCLNAAFDRGEEIWKFYRLGNPKLSRPAELTIDIKEEGINCYAEEEEKPEDYD